MIPGTPITGGDGVFFRGANLFMAMSRLMLKSAKRASLIENLRNLCGLGKMRVR